MLSFFKKRNLINEMLLFLIFAFPLSFFLGSFMVNMFIFLISIFFLLNSYIQKKNILNKQNIILSFFFLSIFVTEIFTYYNLENLVKSIFYSRFLILFLAIEYIINNSDDEKIKKILRVLSYFLLVFLLDLLFQYFSGKNIFGYVASYCDVNGDNCQRFAGIFDDELIAGGFISTILISVFFVKLKFYNNFIYHLFPVILLFFVYITGERSSFFFLLIFIILFYIFIFENKKKLLLVISVASLTLFLLLFLFNNDSLKKRYSKEIFGYFYSPISQSYSLKNFLSTSWGKHFHTSYLMFKDKPIFGNGFKSFRYKCNNYDYLDKEEIKLYGDVRWNRCSTHSHNFHLELLSDKGILVYILFLLFFLLKILDLWDKKILFKNRLNFLIFIYVFLLIFLPRPTGSILSTTYASFFWYSIAICLSLIKKNKTNVRN